MAAEVDASLHGQELSPCRRLSKFTTLGDAVALEAELETLRARVGQEAMVQTITTSDFGERGSKSVLHNAASRGRATILRVLLKARASVNATDDPGNTALHYAVQRGHARAARILLEAGADAACRNNFGKTPGHFAEENSWDTPDTKAGKVLVRQMLTSGTQAVSWEAMPPEDVPAVPDTEARPVPPPQAERAAGFWAMQSTGGSTEDSSGTADAGRRRRLTGPVDRWAPSNPAWAYEPSELSTAERDVDQETGRDYSLAELVKMGNAAAVEQRIKQAYDRGGKDEAIAEASNCEEDSEDVRVVNSPLHCAARKGDVKILRILLATRADPNLANDTGDTLLHLAASMGREEAVVELLRAGADPNLKNHFGKTPGDHAEPQPWENPEMQKAKESTRKSFLGGATPQV